MIAFCSCLSPGLANNFSHGKCYIQLFNNQVLLGVLTVISKCKVNYSIFHLFYNFSYGCTSKIYNINKSTNLSPQDLESAYTRIAHQRRILLQYHSRIHKPLCHERDSNNQKLYPSKYKVKIP